MHIRHLLDQAENLVGHRQVEGVGNTQRLDEFHGFARAFRIGEAGQRLVMRNLAGRQVGDGLVGDLERALAHGAGHLAQARLGLFHHAGKGRRDIAVAGVEFPLFGEAVHHIAQRQDALLRRQARPLQADAGFRNLGRGVAVRLDGLGHFLRQAQAAARDRRQCAERGVGDPSRGADTRTGEGRADPLHQPVGGIGRQPGAQRIQARNVHQRQGVLFARLLGGGHETVA